MYQKCFHLAVITKFHYPNPSFDWTSSLHAMLIERIVSEIATIAPWEESTVKRKKIVFTIEEKLEETINQLQKGTSYTVITEKYGIGRLTVQYTTV